MFPFFFAVAPSEQTSRAIVGVCPDGRKRELQVFVLLEGRNFVACIVACKFNGQQCPYSSRKNGRGTVEVPLRYR